MIRSHHDYEEVYRTREWAYGDKPDQELIRCLVDLPRGRAVDIGGGQGRHALALATLGFEVQVIDSAATGLHQATEAAQAQGLAVHSVNADVAHYEPEVGLIVAVAALFFHIPSHRTSLQVASRIGAALDEQGLFYFSIPGYSPETVAFANELVTTAGCKRSEVGKHLVTKKERPRLPVPRRNETRVVAFKS